MSLMTSTPYATLFQKYIPDLGQPDEDGWAAGTCPFCGKPDAFRANMRTGRWVCLPLPGRMEEKVGMRLKADRPERLSKAHV